MFVQNFIKLSAEVHELSCAQRKKLGQKQYCRLLLRTVIKCSTDLSGNSDIGAYYTNHVTQCRRGRGQGATPPPPKFYHLKNYSSCRKIVFQ